ncbi:RNA polymerase sigma-32 factor [Bradyrhizobium sp. USDA 4503]
MPRQIAASDRDTRSAPQASDPPEVPPSSPSPSQAAKPPAPFRSASRAARHLEPLEEQELASRWHDQGDRAAIDILVTSHLAFAAGIARRYKRYGLPEADLASEATIGLIKAAMRFQANRGARFSTYARWWIRFTMREYLFRSWSLVRIGGTAGQRRLFFGLRRQMRRFARDDSNLTPKLAALVANELKTSVLDVVAMNGRLSRDVSLNVTAGRQGDEQWQDLLVDLSPDPEALLTERDERQRRTDALHQSLRVLTTRERRIFMARRLAEPRPTLEQLGQELSLSSERVRQIDACAFEKVKRAARRALL